MQPSPKSAMAALDLARAAHSALNDLMPKMALAFNGVASLEMAKETEIFLILLEIHCQVNYFDFFMMSRASVSRILVLLISLLYLFGVDQSQCILRVPQNLKKIAHSDLMFTKYNVQYRVTLISNFLDFPKSVVFWKMIFGKLISDFL